MRGGILRAIAVTIFGMMIATSASAATGRCFVANHLQTADELMADDDTRRYVDANHRLFANVGVNACMDHRQGLRVTAAWLRNALPQDRALDKILAVSAAKGYKPWSLLLALHSKVMARIHREEEATNTAAAKSVERDPIAALIDKVEKAPRKK